MLLIRRESQVVELIGYGLSRAEISDHLEVSRKCVWFCELHTSPGRKIALTITDDGKGFGQRPGPEGIGLQNMRYRARVVRGTLKIASAPNRGTVVTCILPIPRSRLPRAMN